MSKEKGSSMPGFFDTLFGQQQQFQQVPSLGGEQQTLVNNLIQQLGGQLGGQMGGQIGGQMGGQMGGAGGFAPIAQQAREQFEQRGIPGIAERFASMDGQGSSAFANILGESRAGLETGLAAQQAQFGQAQRGQDISALLNLLKVGRPETASFEPTTGLAGPILGTAGTIGGAALKGGAAAGPVGAAGGGLLALLGLLAALRPEQKGAF